MRARHLAGLALVLGAAASAWAQSPVEAARALVARYHQDPAALDRARDLLDAALAKDRKVETMAMLSYVQFLIGDVRATTPEQKLAAYDRGREIGKRAVELAPKSHDAHLWYAINTARWGETKGVLRSLFLLPTIREELGILLELDPRSRPVPRPDRLHPVAAHPGHDDRAGLRPAVRRGRDAGRHAEAAASPHRALDLSRRLLSDEGARHPRDLPRPARAIRGPRARHHRRAPHPQRRGAKDGQPGRDHGLWQARHLRGHARAPDLEPPGLREDEES